MDENIKKVAIVGHGASGIGRACADVLAEKGMSVGVIPHIERAASVEYLTERIKDKNDLFIVGADVSKETLDIIERNRLIFDNPYLISMRENIPELYDNGKQPRTYNEILLENNIKTDSDIYREYKLILEKKSKLSSNVRKIIINFVDKK